MYSNFLLLIIIIREYFMTTVIEKQKLFLCKNLFFNNITTHTQVGTTTRKMKITHEK